MKHPRQALAATLIFIAGCVAASQNTPGRNPMETTTPQIMTVLGPMATDTERPAGALGPVLPHEHLLVDFAGAETAGPDRYDAEEVYRVCLPYLERLRAAGCRTLVECTPAYLGRDPALLVRLARASGLNLVTNTGYYGSGENKFVPAHARVETAEQLAARWTREAREGIDGTGVRPGFIKISVDPGPLSPLHRKLVEAAARTHLATGLTIASHTVDAAAAREELEVLAKQGVDASAFIWVHANAAKDGQARLDAARRGAWIELDGVGPQSADAHVEMVRALKEAGLLDHVLLSQDAGWYHVGEPGGGQWRPFEFFFVEFLPKLRAAGFSEAEVMQLTETNPVRAFAIRPRPSAPDSASPRRKPL